MTTIFFGCKSRVPVSSLRERERERERETQRQRDTETERRRETDRQRQTDRGRETENQRQTDREKTDRGRERGRGLQLVHMNCHWLFSNSSFESQMRACLTAREARHFHVGRRPVLADREMKLSHSRESKYLTGKIPGRRQSTQSDILT